MQTPATFSALPPAGYAAESINTPARSTRSVATGPSITAGRMVIACGFLLLALAILALAAVAPAGHDVPDAGTFLNFP